MPTLRLLAFARRFTHAVTTEALRCELQRRRHQGRAEESHQETSTRDDARLAA